MPVQDMDPGLNPQAGGTWSFGVEGSAASVTLDAATGNAAFAGAVTAAGMSGPLSVSTAGGAARMGRATLVSGGATVSTTAVTAGSNIFMCVQVPGGSVGTPRVASRIAGTSFTIASSQGTDTSTVAWLIVEPA